MHRLERLMSSDSRLAEILAYNLPIGVLPESQKFQDVPKDCEHLVAELETAQPAPKEALNLAKSYAAKIRALFHPLRTFPAEILIEIFRYCVPCYLQDEYQDSLDPKTHAWVLSHVCRRWRAIVLSDPHLWRAVDLPLYNYRHVPLDRIVHWLGELLARSSRSDIFLRVRDDEKGIIEHPEIFSTLRRVLGRARIMDLSLPFKTVQDHFSLPPLLDTSIFPFTYDRLASLVLWFQADEQDHSPLSKTLAPSHLLETFLPVLTSFEQHHGPQISVPVDRLLAYSTSSWPSWELLRRMLLLRELHALLPPTATPTLIDHSPLSSDPLLFNDMTSLSLLDYGPAPSFSPSFYVTERMRLPQLATLTLRYIYYDRSDIRFPVLYHPETLTRLNIHIYGCMWIADELAEFLELTINVEELKLEIDDTIAEGKPSRQMLEEMTITDSDGPDILPRLRILELCRSITSKLPKHTVRMAVSRAIFQQGKSEIPRCSIYVSETWGRRDKLEKAWETVMSQNEEWREATAKVSFGFDDAFPLRKDL